MRIRHRLQRRERFRRDDEERLGGIEIANRLGEVGTVNVGHEPERHGSIAVVLERFEGHDRSEVRTADADVDDIPNAFTGVSFPLPILNAVGEIGHPIEHGVDLGYHVLAVDHDRCVPGCAQGDVQDCSLLRDVDLVASEHRIDPRSQARFLCQFDEKADGVGRDAILGVIQEEAHILGRHPLTACGVTGEQIAQMKCSGLLVVG